MKLLLITLSALLLTSCASYTPKPLAPEAQIAAFESRSLDTADVRQFFERSLGHEVAPWPPKFWDITTLTLTAFYFHPDLDMARAQRLLAEAGVITAGGRPNPAAAFSIQRNTDAPTGQSPWTYGLNIDVPLETAGKRDYRIEQARYLAQAAKLREAEAIWQVHSRVRASLLATYPTEAAVRRQKDLQEQIARLLERRLAEGYASQPEVTQAHLALNQITLALRENQKLKAENLAKLAATVGLPAHALEAAALSFDTFEQVPPASVLPSAALQHEALLSRPDVLAALAEYEASQSALQLEVARQYPDIALGPGYLWDAGQVKWSLGLSLALPLLNRNQGPIAEAEARREQAAANFLSVQAKAIGEVEQVLAGYGHAVALFESAAALLHDQQKNERAATAAFKAGASDRLAWLSAQYETATAELAYINALSQAQQTVGHLEDALRRPIGGDMLPATAEQAVMARQLRNGEQP